MPPIRITASNSSKHTPKSIAKHQAYKSTGLHPGGAQQSKKSATRLQSKTGINNAKTDYIITGYNDLVLYPEIDINLEDDDEDETIGDEYDYHTTNGVSVSREHGVIRAIHFLLNHRFDPKLPAVAKGVITKTFKNKILEKREMYPRIIIKNQLYAMFVNEITKVDKDIEGLIRSGELMKLLINHIHFNDNLIVLKKDYLSTLNKYIEKNPDLQNFKDLLLQSNGVSIFTLDDLKQRGIDTSILISYGFLNYTQEQSEFQISLPNLGNYLNFLKQSTLFINYTIQKTKTKQILEKNLIEKWELNHHNWYKFFGVQLKFILSLSYGMGFIENFSTNVGNGWKLA